MQHNTWKDSWIRVGLIGISIFILPLIVKGVIINQSEVEQLYYQLPISPYDLDLYNIARARVLMLVVILIGINILIAGKYLHHEIKLHKVFIPLAVFYLLLVISAFLSEYRDIAMMGFTERYEGLYVFTYYVLLTVTAYILIANVKDVLLIYRFFMGSALVLSLIGLIQFLGGRVITSDFANKVLYLGIDEFYALVVDTYISMTSSPSTVGQIVSSTLYNPNYVGSYGIMAISVSTGLFFISNHKRMHKIFYYLLTLMIFFLMIASKSNGAVYSLAILTLTLLIAIIYKKNWILARKSFVLGGGMVIVLIGMNIISKGGTILEYGIDSPSTNNWRDVTDYDIPLEGLYFENGNAYLEDAFSKVSVQNEDGQYIVESANQVISILKYNLSQTDYVYFDDESFRQWAISFTDYGVEVLHGQSAMKFSLNEQGEIGIWSPIGLVTTCAPTNSLIMNGDFATARGFIWSQYMGLIKESPLIGYGLDTYGIYFPHLDLVNLINYKYDAASLVLNPHNMYIMLAFAGGIPCLIAFLLFVGWYVIRNLQLFFKKDQVYSSYGKIAFFAILGFLITAIVNDSVISVAPVFYIMLGVALATVFKKLEE